MWRRWGGCVSFPGLHYIACVEKKKPGKNFHRAANYLQCLTSNLLAQCSVYQAVVLQASMHTAAQEIIAIKYRSSGAI